MEAGRLQTILLVDVRGDIRKRTGITPMTTPERPDDDVWLVELRAEGGEGEAVMLRRGEAIEAAALALVNIPWLQAKCPVCQARFLPMGSELGDTAISFEPESHHPDCRWQALVRAVAGEESES